MSVTPIAERGSPALPALTTLFTPPASCFTDVYGQPLGQIIKWFIFPSIKQECFPPYGATAPTFSPGICPLNFSTVAQTVTVLAGKTTNELTQVTCCPLSFTITDVSLIPTNTAVVCETMATETKLLQLTATSYDSSIKSGSGVYGPIPLAGPTFVSVFAQPFVAMWQKTDTAIIQLLASSNPSATISPVVVTAIPSTGARLSDGAIAGIVVGVLVGSVLIGALLIYLCIRWRRRSTGNTTGAIYMSKNGTDISQNYDWHSRCVE